jgi:mono/diheme cytochrome c family protein
MTGILATCLVVAGLGTGLLVLAGAGRAEAAGDPDRGRALFESRQCAQCHRPRGQEGVGPAVDELRRPQGAFELAGRLWNHAPTMFTTVKEKGIEWPQISPAEMADLMAYLQGDSVRDPAPDLFKGRAALVRKGCLKCHSLRGEGARVGPDLSERRNTYDSAVAWAAAMWVHTPRMAVKAAELGVLYPRFAGDELANLVGFLRSAVR